MHPYVAVGSGTGVRNNQVMCTHKIAPMALIGEFLVEPFVPGNPGPHVIAAWAAAEDAGGSLEVGPFGTVVRAATESALLDALDAGIRAALANGATRVATQLTYE